MRREAIEGGSWRWVPEENDIRQVEILAEEGLTQELISACLGVSERWLRDQIHDPESPLFAAWRSGRGRCGRGIVRRYQELFKTKDKAIQERAMRWYLQNGLGVGERPSHDHEVSVTQEDNRLEIVIRPSGEAPSDTEDR